MRKGGIRPYLFENSSQDGVPGSMVTSPKEGQDKRSRKMQKK